MTRLPNWLGSAVRVTVASALVLALTSCSSDDDAPAPAPSPSETPSPVPEYDAGAEPSAAVLSLVPADATELRVTDYDQIRLQLGEPTLTGESKRLQREKFARKAARLAPLLDPGLLRTDERRLEGRYGVTQDDVLWEAHFETPRGQGWVFRLRDDLDLSGVQRAVEDGVGVLAGALVDTTRQLVGTGVAASPEESWAADPELVALAGDSAGATYISADCLALDSVFGSGVEDELAPATSGDLADLDPLGPFSLAFSGPLATARLGIDRPDAFVRARLAETFPRTTPDFARGFTGPLADPAGGRIGYTLAATPLAVELTLARQLPFAVCAT